jgi:hypothetical protein
MATSVWGLKLPDARTATQAPDVFSDMLYWLLTGGLKLALSN